MERSMYEIAGGQERIQAMATVFYKRVLADPLLLPLFTDPNEDHAGRMALWFSEEFGGPAEHSQKRGGPVTLERVHSKWKFTDQQRERWIEHMITACAEVGMSNEFMVFFEPHIQYWTKVAQDVSWR